MLRVEMSILYKMSLVTFLRFIPGNQNDVKTYKDVWHDEETEKISIYNTKSSNIQEDFENESNGKCK